MHSKKSIRVSDNPQLLSPLLQGQKIPLQDLKHLEKPTFPFLPQNKLLFYQMFTEKASNSSQLSIQPGEQEPAAQYYSARYDRDKKKDRYATIDVMFKSQDPSINNIKLLTTPESKIKGSMQPNSTSRRYFFDKKHPDQSPPNNSQKYLKSIKLKKQIGERGIKSVFKSQQKREETVGYHKLQRITKVGSKLESTSTDFNSRKNHAAMEDCLNKFSYRQKLTEDMNKSLNTTNLGLLTNRNHFQQIQRLKMTLYNRKLQQKQKQLNRQGIVLDKFDFGYQMPPKGQANKVVIAPTKQKSDKNSKIDKNRKMLPEVEKAKGERSFENNCEPWENEAGDTVFWDHYY